VALLQCMIQFIINTGLCSELTGYPLCFTALVSRLRTQIGDTFTDFDWNKGNTTSTKKVLFSIMSLHLRLG
jgi:hypothetical protein